MIYIETGSTNPFYNLAFEEYVFHNIKDDYVLMLWQDSPSIICGCYQNIFAEVSISRANEAEIPVIRRITGGGTVYHDLGNLNYTMIKNESECGFGYGAFLDEMTSALNKLGISAEKSRTCDISVDGKKISGNAQKNEKGRVLHHGTLLFNTDLNALKMLTRGHNDAFESRSIKSSPFEVTNISSYTDIKSVTEFKYLLKNILCKDGYTEYKPTGEQLSEIVALVREKYISYEWNIGSNPAFKYKNKITVYGCEIPFEISSKNGKITGIILPPEYDATLLVGAPLYRGIDFENEILNKIYDSITE